MTVVPYSVVEQFEATVEIAALQVLAEAMRECPEDPIETFFGIGSSHPNYHGIVKALDSMGVEWKR